MTRYGNLACPVYLLLDLRTVWNEAEGKLQALAARDVHLTARLRGLSLARRFPSMQQAFFGLGKRGVGGLVVVLALAALLANTLRPCHGAEDVVPLIVGKLCSEAGSSKHHAFGDGRHLRCAGGACRLRDHSIWLLAILRAADMGEPAGGRAG